MNQYCWLLVWYRFVIFCLKRLYGTSLYERLYFVFCILKCLICSTEYFESKMHALSYFEMFYGLAFDFLLIEYKWISFIRCLTKIIIWNRIIWMRIPISFFHFILSHCICHLETYFQIVFMCIHISITLMEI